MASLTEAKPTTVSILPRNFWKVLLICLILLILCIIVSLLFGARSLTIQQLLDGLLHRDASYEASVVQRRISRTVFSLCCGAALGIAGALMQSVTRSPIADPSILGVNSGAALFVVCGISYMNISTAGEYIVYALAGAMITAVIVFGISSMGSGGATPLKLVLAGAAMTAALSSLVTAVLIPKLNVMNQFRFWQAGSVGNGDWNEITALAPFLLTGIILAFITAPALNAMALGDEAATALGVKTGLVRLASAFAGVLLCAVTTAMAGPIGFVGLLASHVIRLVLGPDIRLLIPMAGLAGAIILTLSDVVGRLLGRPGELEVGVITAFIGAPILIIIAMKAKARSL